MKTRWRITIIPDTRPKESFTEWTKKHWPFTYWSLEIRAVSRREGDGRVHAFGYNTNKLSQP